MRILVTGAAGHVGHHLVDYILRNTPWHIVALDRLDSAGDWGRLGALPGDLARGRLEFVHRDLRAEIHEHRILGSSPEPFDHVCHLAAGSHVDRSVKDPLLFVHDNVLGTAHLLEWVRRGNLRHGGKFLYFSTDEVFGAAEEHEVFGPYDRFNPTNPYSAAKAGGECLAHAWAATYGLPIVTTHCTNLFGPGQNREKAIPLFIEQILRGEEVQIHANADRTMPCSRFYLYVENACAAVLHLLSRGEVMDGSGRRGKYNITGDEEISNLSLARTIADLLGKPLLYRLVDFVPGRPRHDMRYAIDGSALRELGWAPHISVAEGLRRVIAAET